MMERGAKLFFKGLVEEMEPALRDLEALTKDAGPAMRSFLKEMGPAMAELFADIKDFSAYHPPEVQPNGDILIRRKSYDDKGETDGGSPNEDRPHSDPMPAPEGDNPVQKDGKIDI